MSGKTAEAQEERDLARMSDGDCETEGESGRLPRRPRASGKQPAKRREKQAPAQQRSAKRQRAGGPPPDSENDGESEEEEELEEEPVVEDPEPAANSKKKKQNKGRCTCCLVFRSPDRCTKRLRVVE